MNTSRRHVAHPPVRALSRGLAILAELNAGGPASAQDLARRSGLNRTTSYRLLETLRHEGFVAHDALTGRFSATPAVRRLSDGVTVRDVTSQAALPAMFELLREVSWPSDLAMFEAGSVVIRESTHPFSPFSVHRSMIGRRRSLFRSALGRAILAAATPKLRRDMVELAAATASPDAQIAKDDGLLRRILSQTRRDGYASSVGETDHNISAIAVAITAGSHVVGGLNLVFFSSSMSPGTAADRYLANLQAAARSIESRLSLAHGPRVAGLA